MARESYDVVVIGGGFAGVATAYHLARNQASVLLLEADGLASGTSGACAGRAQVSESHGGVHLDLVLAGLERLETLEEELGCAFEWRRLGNLMLIEREEHWRAWTEKVAQLVERGVPAAMLDLHEVAAREPALEASGFRGAAWCLEGHLNPFAFCQAYAAAARRHGAVLREQTPVVGFVREGARITAVQTPDAVFAAGAVMVAAGAWTDKVLRQAGASLPVQHTHAEAMISERLPPILHHHVGLADFYETIHGEAQAVSVGIAQQAAGTLLVTEAVEMGAELHRRNSHWGVPGMARDLLQLFPGLAGVRILRTWAAPSPFLPDEQPAIGWIPGLDNLFAGTCFHLTITTIPVLSEMMSAMILRRQLYPELAPFDPGRFVRGGT